MGCVKPALPCVRIECVFITEGMAIGQVIAIRPVSLATAYARALGVAGPAVRVGTVEMVLLAAACAGCTAAATPFDAEGDMEVAPGTATLDPASDHGPALGLDGVGVASDMRCITEGAAVPTRTKQALGTKVVRS